MEITRHTAGEFVELRVKGRLDGYWADHLGKQLELVIRGGAHRLRLNLAEVSYISSIGIRVLVQFYQQLVAIQGVFVVSTPSEAVKRVLAMARLDELLMPETPPPAAQQTAEIPRPYDHARATLAVYNSEPGASLECRVFGDPGLLGGCRFGAEHSRTMLFPETSLAVGLGAFGDTFEDCQGRFGEFLAVAGAAAYQPTDGSNVPDYLLAEGSFVPELQVLYGMTCQGGFAHLVRLDAKPEAGAVSLGELAGAALQVAGTDAAGVVLVAESAGLVGAALRQSPALGASDGAPFQHPGVRQWLMFTSERAYSHTLTVAVGIVAREPGPELTPLVRPISPGGPQGHFHAAAFSYRPLKKGRIDLAQTIRSLFAHETLHGVLHLLADEREGAGAGQSQFVRGACWVSPISRVVSESA